MSTSFLKAAGLLERAKAAHAFGVLNAWNLRSELCLLVSAAAVMTGARMFSGESLPETSRGEEFGH